MIRSHKPLSILLEDWARWCQGGKSVASTASTMSRIMAEGGNMTFGGGATAPVVDCVELDIEMALATLAKTHPQAVDTLRVDTAAIYTPRLKSNAPQIEKAHYMGVSLRTYQRRLTLCRHHLNNHRS